MYLLDQSIFSGDTVEIKRIKATRKPKTRSKKCKIVSDKQKLLNDIHGRMKLTRLINENFSHAARDVFATLEFFYFPTYAQAKKVKEIFLRALRTEMKKQGRSLKYIICYEHGEKKPHFHLIVNHIDYDTLLRIWRECSCGGVWYEYIRDQADHEALAAYLTKEKKGKNGPKWSCSKNLKKPTVTPPKLAKGRHITVPKGYKEISRIYKDSEFAGLIEYVKAIRVDKPMPKAGEPYAYDRGTVQEDAPAASGAPGPGKKKAGRTKRSKNSGGKTKTGI